MTAITAITVQNTVEVRDVYPLPPEVDRRPGGGRRRGHRRRRGEDRDARHASATIEAVDRALDLVGDAPVVLDPVMVAESGAVLLDGDARDALRERILPRATVVTPNLPEARVLADGAAPDDADAAAARARDPRARTARGGRDRRAPRGRRGRLLRRRAARGDRRRAPPRRRRARLRLHALVDARGAARPRARPARRGARGQGHRGRGGPRRAALDRRRCRARSTCSGWRAKAGAAAARGRSRREAAQARCHNPWPSWPSVRHDEESPRSSSCA